jgi:D-alanyl-D-alanine carboxypeptidase
VRDAFRGVDDQAWLIRQELLRGEDVGQVLSAIAAPGYSQHHTGQALDIERIPAGADFETTAAFEWLCRNAAEYGFELSYPRDNPYGIMYEPWHWYCNIENTPDRS